MSARHRDSRPEKPRPTLAIPLSWMGCALALLCPACGSVPSQADDSNGALLRPTQVEAAQARAAPTPPEASASPETVASVLVEADATRTAPADPQALRAVLGALPLTNADAGTSDAARASQEPDWFRWGRLNASRTRAAALLPAALPADSLRVYTVRFSEGATVCLANRSGQKVRARVRLHLPRGVYRIERLTLAPPTAGVASAAAPGSPADASDQMAGEARPAETSATLEGRLERTGARDLGRPAAITAYSALEPGQVCLLRATDEAAAVNLALAALRLRLHELAVSAPGPARRLRRILGEGRRDMGDLRARDGRASSRERRLERIHHLLLVVAQALSLHRNFQERGLVQTDAATAVMDALTRLADALSEASAAILGLVPQVTVETPPTDAPAPQTDPAGALDRRITVGLANTGSRSVDMVKIGLNLAALPANVTCKPTDAAFFGTLRPGQAVRATFQLHVPAAVRLPGSRCIGDVSYFAAHAPAHLRPHAW